MNTDKPTLSREFALVRVVAERQDAALSVAGAWSARLIELSEGHFTAELSTTPERLSQFLAALAEHGQVTAVRSGALSFG
jgi:acetolactate synthase small subunit